MSAALTVAAISAAVALLSIALNAKTARSTAILQAGLQAELDQQREREDKAARLQEVVTRYRDPLLSAAFDLQSRIYNLVVGDFWSYIRSNDSEDQRYAVRSTLFVIGQYLAWAEALRLGVQFLDLGDLRRNQDLVVRLEAIRSAFATDSRFGPPFRVFRVDQRAIGELMLEASPASAGPMLWHCIGYATFCQRLDEDKAFASWFAKLDRDVHELATTVDPAVPRLVAMQHNLVDLLQFLDQPAVRFSEDLRSKISIH